MSDAVAQGAAKIVMLPEPFQGGSGRPAFRFERATDADHRMQGVEPLTYEVRQPHQNPPVLHPGQDREAFGRCGLGPDERVDAGPAPSVHPCRGIGERLGREISRGYGREGVHPDGLACTR